MYSLNTALEKSVANYISANVTSSLSANYYTGQGNAIVTAPAVKVEVISGNEVYIYTRVYRMTTTIEVKEMANDTTTNNIGVLAGNVFNLFYDNNAPSNFTNTNYGVAVFQVQPLDSSTEIEGDALVSKHTFDIVCCQSGTTTIP